MGRSEKFHRLFAYAQLLFAADTLKTFDQLAAWLNEQGITTNRGTPYSGGRGVAKLCNAAYDFVHDELGLGDEGAYPIAAVFTDRNGNHAYD